MAVPYQVQNVVAQQTDGNILITWNGSLGATGYQVQRSTDGANFSNLGLPTTSAQYVDSFPGIGVMFYYQVVAYNTSGNAPASLYAQMVAAPPGEMSLFELRLRSQQRADRVNSAFVLNSEWNYNIRLGLYELYDILTTVYEDYNLAPPAFINTSINQSGSQFLYALPDGATNYLGGTLGQLTGTPAPRLFKISGLDLGVNTSNNVWVTIHRFDWIERNNYVYPNSTSTIYGVYNMRYRPMGQNLAIIPTPAGNQQLRLWYAPVLPQLLADTDLTTIGWSGWLSYVITRAAKYAKNKEETDTPDMDQELLFLKSRITEAASNRDQGQADTISNTRRDPIFGGGGWGDGGANGGWLAMLFPMSLSNNVGDHLLAHSINLGQSHLSYAALCVAFAYFLYFGPTQLCRRISFSGIRDRFVSQINGSAFGNFISHVFKRRSKE